MNTGGRNRLLRRAILPCAAGFHVNTSRSVGCVWRMRTGRERPAYVTSPKVCTVPSASTCYISCANQEPHGGLKWRDSQQDVSRKLRSDYYSCK